MVDTPFTSFAYALSGGSALRTTPARLGDIVNGAEFGLVGNGSTDNRIALQAALDATFGDYTTPSSHNKYTNRWLLLPAGNFRFTVPLYVHNAQGGGIIGVGAEATTLSYEWSDAGNAIATSGSGANDINPALMLAGCSYMTVGGFTLGSNDHLGNSTHRSVGIFLYQGANQQSSVTGQCTADLFDNMIVQNFYTGILGGLGGDGGNCDGMTFRNVALINNHLAGIRPGHANALNYLVIGGGGAGNGAGGTGSPNTTFGNCGAMYSMPIVPMTFEGIQCSGNTVDFAVGAGKGCSITGGSSESVTCLVTSGGSTVRAFDFRNENSSGMICADCTGGGSVVFDSCGFLPGNDTGTGYIAVLDNSGQAILINSEVASGGHSLVISGAAGSKVHRIGGLYNIVGADIFSGYTGTVIMDTYALGTPLAVASLPTAAAKFAGLRGSVTDANATTFMSTVAGSGSNKVPVFCDGTNWKIG